MNSISEKYINNLLANEGFSAQKIKDLQALSNSASRKLLNKKAKDSAKKLAAKKAAAKTTMKKTKDKNRSSYFGMTA